MIRGLVQTCLVQLIQRLIPVVLSPASFSLIFMYGLLFYNLPQLPSVACYTFLIVCRVSFIVSFSIPININLTNPIHQTLHHSRVTGDF